MTGSHELIEGYHPGLLGWMGAAHGRYYASRWGFGRFFEAKVTGEIAEFATRLDHPDNAIWSWLEDGAPVGSIAIDGDARDDEGAHLRWFIVDGARAGTGIGRALLRRALTFCEGREFARVHLWTFAGLDAARHLYEASGFELRSEHEGSQWGTTMTEQCFVARLGPSRAPADGTE